MNNLLIVGSPQSAVGKKSNNNQAIMTQWQQNFETYLFIFIKKKYYLNRRFQ